MRRHVTVNGRGLAVAVTTAPGTTLARDQTERIVLAEIAASSEELFGPGRLVQTSATTYLWERV